jgi:ubiquitin carboxyl-terminal hydrolase 22/27/51
MFLTDEPIVLREKSDRKQLVLAFQRLMKDFWKENPPQGTRSTMFPRGFFQTLFNVLEETNNGWYCRGQQADAAEAIQYILESLHDGIYKTVTMSVSGESSNCEEVSQIKAIESWATYFGKEYSPIIQNFYGQTQIRIQCETCKSVSERYEPWLMIKTPIPGGEVVGGPAPTLDTCLTAAFAPESLDDYECTTCSLREGRKVNGKATITNRISRLPPIVILSVKRFTNDGNKVRGKLAWDLDRFDLGSVFAFSRNPFSEIPVQSEYETFAVIEHHGSLQGGHYTMFARQNETWMEYDDNSISDVAPDRVVSADSYILFLLPKAEKVAMHTKFAESVKALRQQVQSESTKDENDATEA